MDEFSDSKTIPLDYNEILDSLAEKVINKADKLVFKLDDVELGSKEYFKLKCYSDALYMAMSMLSNEERIYKRKHKIK